VVISTRLNVRRWDLELMSGRGVEKYFFVPPQGCSLNKI
jgi:hypothetical protein